MNDKINNNLSRPKVHRLPEVSALPEAMQPTKIIVVSGLVLLVVAAIPALAYITSWAPSSLGVQQTTASGISSLKTESTEKETALLVHDDNGQVVGQLAKIPMDAEQQMNVNTTKNVDSNTGKELLSIIGKY